MRRIPLVVVLAVAVSCAAVRPTASDTIERITVSVTVPNPCWKIQIRKGYRKKDELLVVSELAPPPAGAICAQVVSVTRDEIGVRVETPRPRVRHLVLDPAGRGRSGDAAVTFVANTGELEKHLEGAEPLSGRSSK